MARQYIGAPRYNYIGARLDIIIDVRANIYIYIYIYIYTRARLYIEARAYIIILMCAPHYIDVARQYIDVRASIIIWARTSI